MSDNPQFIRTDKAIIQALISILKRKPFEKITVQDILNETPVTRATFYAHYRDKFEIAEKMLGQCIAARDTVRKSLSSCAHPSLEMMNQSYQIDREFTQALAKIHTENVDLRKALANELCKEYLEGATSPTKEIEATIYAQSYVELYLALINAQAPTLSLESTYQIFISVALAILHLSDDLETRKFLEDKIAKRIRSTRNDVL